MAKEDYYCPICGRFYHKKEDEGTRPSHKCSPKVLRGINAASTRAINGNTFYPEPSLHEQLKDGFSMLNDDEVVSFRERFELPAPEPEEDDRSIFF